MLEKSFPYENGLTVTEAFVKNRECLENIEKIKVFNEQYKHDELFNPFPLLEPIDHFTPRHRALNSIQFRKEFDQRKVEIPISKAYKEVTGNDYEPRIVNFKKWGKRILLVSIQILLLSIILIGLYKLFVLLLPFLKEDIRWTISVAVAISILMVGVLNYRKRG